MKNIIISLLSNLQFDWLLLLFFFFFLSNNLSHRQSGHKLAVISNAVTSPLVKCHSVF